jgi:GT2 family glycosyltransferase
MAEATRPHRERQPLPVSLIIPSRNRAEILVETVASILAGDEIPAELIIIDQSDEENSALAQLTASACRVRYIHSRATGSSRARNDGIAAASHRVLVFTDDDVRVAPDWLGRLVHALESAGPRSVVTGQVFPAEERAGGFVPSTKVDPDPAVYEGRVGEDILYPHNMALHRDLFTEVGTFDVRLGGGARFAGAEDNDFCFRVLEAGYRILYVPGAVVHHRAWRSHADYLPLRWSYGRGQGGYYAKHMSLRDRHMLHRFTWELRHRAGRMLRRLLRDPRRAAGEAVYLAGLVTGVAEWLVTQRHSS